MTRKTNLTGGRAQTNPFEEVRCSPSLVHGLQQEATYLSSANILFSFTVFLGNSLILVALRNESSLHPPSKLLYRCLGTTDLLVGLVTQPLHAIYWMSIVYEHWSLCQYVFDAVHITSYALCGVSLLTLTAMSVDRLVALFLGLRYRQVVTLKRTYIIVAIFWVLSGVGSLLYCLDRRITSWYSHIGVPSCLVVSIASYTNIFRALRYHNVKVQDHIQQQLNHPNTLNITRYKKAVNSSLLIYLALLVFYLPYGTVEIVIR